MGDEDGGDAGFLLDLLDLDAHLLAHVGVKRRQRLVEQKHLRLEDDGAGQRDALLLAAGKLRGQFLLAAGQPHHGKRLADLAGDLGLRHVAVFQPEGDIVEDRLVREQRIALEDQADVALVDGHVVDTLPADHDLATGDVDEPGDGAQDRRLAAAGRSEQRDEAALSDRQREVAHRDELAIGDFNAAELDRGAARPGGRVGCPGRNRPGTGYRVLGLRHLSRSCSTAWSRRPRCSPSRSDRRRSATSSCRSCRRPAASRSSR